MRKSITGMIAAAVVAATVVTLPTSSEARWRGRGGWGIGAGVFGGLAAGALIGSAIAGPRYYAPYYGYGYRPYYAYYGPRPYYRPRPYYGYAPGFAYVGGPYAYYRGCSNRRVWTPYGWRWRRVCY
ncbi:hypothetical protein RA307_20000 [Xanthobacteraceae bacterium Astr-EGSB]|uniref:hypothetical protein n=1 Tax=Astrobacterium formosum TaxID=3069710 RepID=UPI0027B5F2A0|nr:hypothetical protein [Xanthobacteraceae bacterium Astr-EGSB]